MSLHENLFAPPPPALLPSDAGPTSALAAGEDPASVAARWPACSAPWAALADLAFERGDPVASYAYARVGYHRGLDGLRRAGWKGHGPVPWSHEPNRGFLRSLWALGRAAATIGELDEAERCRQLLADSDPEAAAALG